MQRKGRILIVDDNGPLAENLREIFEDEGMEASVFTDPAGAARSIADGSRYDLLVTDFRMPGMNGVELVRRIKEVQPELPAIMMSAYLGDVDAEAARAAGVREVLRKPEDLRRLVEHAREAGRDRGVA